MAFTPVRVRELTLVAVIPVGTSRTVRPCPVGHARAVTGVVNPPVPVAGCGVGELTIDSSVSHAAFTGVLIALHPLQTAVGFGHAGAADFIEPAGFADTRNALKICTTGGVRTAEAVKSAWDVTRRWFHAEVVVAIEAWLALAELSPKALAIQGPNIACSAIANLLTLVAAKNTCALAATVQGGPGEGKEEDK